nr:hypothetical protein [Tanacetum cinerariifolium]
MSQGTLGSHLNGHRPVTQKLAVGMAKLLGVPISKFSTRLANDISEMAEAVGESFAGNTSQKGSGDLPPARSYSMTHEEMSNDPREVVMALFIIASRAATLGLSPSQAKTIIRIRNEIVHSLPDQHSALPSNLDGIAAAAFKVSEEGGVSDDLMSMLKHGLSKQSHREQAKDNHPLFYGVVQLKGQIRYNAYVKMIPARLVYAEVLASLRGRALGLPIPLTIPVYAKGQTVGITSAHVLCVASLDCGATPISRIARLDDVNNLLHKWTHIRTAIVFDELIANADRNLRNILMGADGKIWLIDHEEALRFLKGYNSGIHGVVLGDAREGIGYDLEDIISQGVALCSSLSQIHAEDSKNGHDRHDHKAAMMLVVPQPSTIEMLKPAAHRTYRERILMLEDMAEKKNFDFLTVHSAFEGAKQIQRLEKAVA